MSSELQQEANYINQVLTQKEKQFEITNLRLISKVPQQIKKIQFLKMWKL